MKKFQVTWVEKAYYTTIVEAESFEQAETMVEADFDSFFEGVDGYIVNESFMTRWTDDECEDGVDYHYSSNWAQGGPIIERGDIAKIERFSEALWEATAYTKNAQDIVQSGPNPLVAAMRCYVASQLGDEVELPEELVGVKLCS